MDAQATELIIAVKAINFFFSLNLVLFGSVNLLLILGNNSNRYSLIVVLSATCVLWFARVLLQIIHPQGSVKPILQYSMLASFIIVFLCFAIPLVVMLMNKSF